MKTDNNIKLQFYQNLGKLFYAIAAVDNVVRAEEVSAVKKWVKTYWLDKNFVDASSKNNAEYVILNTFYWLCKDEEYCAKSCYNGFINFKRQNESLFTDEVNTRILKTAGKIAASFSGQNKAELIMLANLNIELKKRK